MQAKAAECSNGKRALPTKAAPEAAAAGSRHVCWKEHPQDHQLVLVYQVQVGERRREAPSLQSTLTGVQKHEPKERVLRRAKGRGQEKEKAGGRGSRRQEEPKN